MILLQTTAWQQLAEPYTCAVCYMSIHTKSRPSIWLQKKLCLSYTTLNLVLV